MRLACVFRPRAVRGRSEREFRHWSSIRR